MANWRGAWSSGTAYIADDSVSYSGAEYFCVTACTGQTPSSSADWALQDSFEGAAAGFGTGVTTGSQAWLFVSLPALAYTAITRNTSEAATSATVAWPDGTAGAYTADVLSSAFPGAVDAYHVTYSGHTVTQPQVTRDASGAVTAQPALTYV
jgi:hypothetical protein